MENAIYEQSHLSNSPWDFSVTTFIENYGWYLLFVAFIILCIYRKAQPTIDKYLKNQADQEYAAKYHKNPDLAIARLAAQEAAVQKLQEKYEKDTEVYKQKMEEKEVKRREELLARFSSSGQRLGGSTSSNKEQTSLKPEYNPLMGDTSRSYKAQKKSACSGGGCGK